jgi:DNA-binding NarL/FixJ family response regulator
VAGEVAEHPTTPGLTEVPVVATAQPVRVVVVDDSPDIRDLLRLQLDADGFEVVGVAADGRTALEMCRREQPDVVTLDLAMPGVGGLEALPTLRHDCPHTKVVVYTAYDGFARLAQVRDAGAAAYITKGVSMRRLTEHLRRVLESDATEPVGPFPLRPPA